MEENDRTPSAKNRLVDGVLWISAGRMFTNGLGIVSTLILARLLAPDDFGIVAIVMSIMAVITMTTEMSLSSALVQLRELKDNHFHTAWTMDAVRGVALTVILVGISFFVGDLYDRPELQLALLVLSSSVLIGAIKNPKFVVFSRNLIFWPGSIIVMAGKIAGFAITIPLAIIYQSYWALILGTIGTQLMTTLLSYAFKPYFPRIDLSEYRDLLQFSIWLTFGKIVQAFLWRSDGFLLGFFMSVGNVGFVSFGQRLSNQLINEISQPIGAVLFPAFTQMRDDPNRLRHAYNRSVGVLALITFPIGAGIASIAEPFVALIYGEKWLGVVPVLQAFVVLNALSGVQRLHPLAMALGETKTLFYRDLHNLFVRIPAVIGGILIGIELGWGPLLGFVAGNIVSSLFFVHYNMYVVSKLSPIRMIDHYKAALTPILASALMALIVIWVDRSGVLVGLTANVFLQLFMKVLIGVIVYVVVVPLLWFARGKPNAGEFHFFELLKVQTARFRNP